MDAVPKLLALIEALRSAPSLEDMLFLVTDATAALLGVERVTLRLLDDTRERLMLAARAGRPVHANDVTFAVGEGLSGWVVEHGRPLRIEDAEKDARFVVRPGQTATIGTYLGVPLLDQGGTMGVLSAIDDQRGRFGERDEEIARLVVGICSPYVQSARLRRLALLDPLTSTLNRRGLDSMFARIADVEPPCLLCVDLDHFKSINDAHGHATGDRVLRAVAATLGEVARHGDDVVRLGGEEFLVVLRGASLGAGARVAERARTAIAALRVEGERGREIGVTASIGVASQKPGESRDAVLARADAAMYRAKAQGRDQVVVDEEA